MNTLQIAIVEDDVAEAQRLAHYLDAYATAKGVAFALHRFTDGAQIAAQQGDGLDIILMDIQMETMDGMEAARRLRAVGCKAALIFVTNMVSYAVRGYQVDALDFLVKPAEYPALESALDRAIARIGQQESKYINVRAGSAYHHIDVRTLLYAEVQDHRLQLITQNGTVQCGGTLRTLEKELVPYGFFLCHAAFLINLDKVETVVGNEAVLGGCHVPVSKHRRKALLEQLAARWGETL